MRYSGDNYIALGNVTSLYTEYRCCKNKKCQHYDDVAVLGRQLETIAAYDLTSNGG